MAKALDSTDYAQRIEQSIEDQPALKKLYKQVEKSKLPENEKAFLLGRIQRYLYDEEKVAQAAEMSKAEDEIMSGEVDESADEG